MDSETRALRRTGLILLIVATARWAWAASYGGRLEGTEPLDVGVMLDSSRTLAADAAERARPLQEGEHLDPNVANARDLDRLPGVGPATAREIVASREREGLFASVEDLQRVRGIGSRTLERLRPHLAIATVSPRLVRRPEAVEKPDLNRADSVSLTALPGIGPALAGRIVRERAKGRFRSVDDLVRVTGIGPASVERLRPLVRVVR